MKLSVAANYDIGLVPKLADLPVVEVYGKLPADPCGGGRPSYMATPLSPSQLADYVASLADHGIAFNYLLNASCLGNREWTRSWQRKLMRLLERLGAMGIRRLTVSTPYLLERIKAAFPDFYIKAGIFAQIDTPRRARFWQDLGADALTLESFSINRDFATLRAIRDAVDCELQLIANHPCLPNCPLQPYHQNGFAHASDGSGGLFIDYCFLECTYRRLEDPSLLIKAAWIRPEDVSFYESLGYTHFKLLERGIPSEDLLERVAAYARRRSGPNLASLMLPYGFTRAPARRRFWLLRNFFKPTQVRVSQLVPLRKMMKEQGMLWPRSESPFRIDSNKIPADFIEGFETRRCRELSCEQCSYCNQIAADSVEVEPSFQRKQLERMGRIRHELTHGRLWDV